MNDYTDRFTALIDANVLACGMRRNIILSLAEAGFFRPRWSDKIMDETAGAIAKITKGALTLSSSVLPWSVPFQRLVSLDMLTLKKG